MAIGKNRSSAKYRRDEQFQNWQFLEPNFDITNWNLLIFQFEKFKKFPFRNFWKIVNFENSKTLKIVNVKNFKNIQFSKSQKLLIWKIPRMRIFLNLKNFWLKKFEYFPISKIPKIFNLGNSEKIPISKIIKCLKLLKYQIF